MTRPDQNIQKAAHIIHIETGAAMTYDQAGPRLYLGDQPTIFASRRAATAAFKTIFETDPGALDIYRVEPIDRPGAKSPTYKQMVRNKITGELLAWDTSARVFLSPLACNKLPHVFNSMRHVKLALYYHRQTSDARDLEIIQVED